MKIRPDWHKIVRNSYGMLDPLRSGLTKSQECYVYDSTRKQPFLPVSIRFFSARVGDCFCLVSGENIQCRGDKPTHWAPLFEILCP